MTLGSLTGSSWSYKLFLPEVINLHGFIDLVEGHVNLDEEHVALIVRTRVELSDKLELARMKRKILVDDKFV
jgi:hypothetical protein